MRSVYGLVVSLCIVSCVLRSGAVHAASPPTPGGASAAQLRSLADAAVAKNDHASAIKLWSELLAVEPSQLNYLKRSQSYQRRKEWGKALADLSESIRLDPKFTTGLMARARLLAMRGDCEAAKEDLAEVQRQRPKKQIPELAKVSACAESISRGEAAMRAGDYANARKHFAEAASVAYDSPKLSLLLAKCDVQLGDFQSALVDTRAVLTSDKTNVEALLLRGMAFYAMDEFEAAFTHYREGLKLAEDHKELRQRFNKLKQIRKLEAEAEQLIAKRKFKEGAAKLAESASLDPSHRAHCFKLRLREADALMEAGDYQAAVDAAGKAIQLQPSNWDAWLKRGNARISAGQYDEAIRDFQHVLQHNHNHQAAHEGMHRAQAESKKAKRKDYYKILGVDRSADEKTIKKEFRKIALTLHPDKATDVPKEEAEARFREYVEAYEVLNDKETRARYDRGEDVTQPRQHQHHHHHGHPFGGQHFHFRWGG